jgi:hypothetical protein
LLIAGTKELKLLVISSKNSLLAKIIPNDVAAVVPADIADFVYKVCVSTN